MAALGAWAVCWLPVDSFAQGSRSKGAGDAAADAAVASTELLLERLVENDMHDVVLWIVDRIESDESLVGLRPTSQFRRGTALVALSRRESDVGKRGKLLDEAQRCFEGFLAANAGDGAAGSDQITAYTEKGSLVVERARLTVEQSKKSDADVASLTEQAVKQFDEAFASFESAEKGILDQLKGISEELASLGGGRKDGDESKGRDGSKGGGGNKKRKPTAESKRDAAKIEELTERQEKLRGQLLNCRLLLASTLFEKSKAFPVGSDDWQKVLDESTKRYAELYSKYSGRGAGLFARYFEGRNQAVMAHAARQADERKKLFERAVMSLGDIRVLEGGGFVPGLKAKAFNTTFECWLELKDISGFDELAEKITVAPAPPDKLDADWLGMKYRGAVILAQKGEAEGAKGRPRLKTAQKVAMEVAKANRDFAKEARELLGKLGKNVGEEPEATFQSSMDDVSVLLGTMKTKSNESKELAKAGKEEEAGKARAEAADARNKAIDALARAMPKAGEEDADQLNRARYITTFLLYDAKRLHEAAALGEFLAERYPNGIGSKDAARVAMASWQLLAKDGPPDWAADARRRSAQLAALIVRIWPADGSSADASIVAIASAAEEGNVKRIIELIDAVPADSPRRTEVLIRGGSALWRAVLERRRVRDAGGAEGDGPPAEQLLAKATQSIDAGLQAVAQGGKADKLAIAAALYRAQIGMEAGDNDLVFNTLTNPVYGPWSIVSSGDTALADPEVAQEALRLSLRFFIQTERLAEAQKAMELLEAAAGDGEDASEKLASMYLAMGRELQEQLNGIVSGGGGQVTAESRARAAAIVAGFEKFLERVSSRDKKVSSQMWVATQLLSLGAGQGKQSGIAQVVPKEKRLDFLSRSAEVYESLLKSDDKKVKESEKAIRLKLATVYRELERWDDAIGHLEWIVGQPKGANTLSVQLEAANFLSAAGAAVKDREKANEYLKQAVIGRQGQDGSPQFWGWSGIANKLQKQAFSGSGTKAAESRRIFFEARLNVPRARLKRAEISEGADRSKQLEMAERDIVLTHKLYPDMGGKEFRTQFDKLLEEIQKQLGRPSTKGVDDLDAEARAEQKPAA